MSTKFAFLLQDDATLHWTLPLMSGSKLFMVNTRSVWITFFPSGVKVMLWPSTLTNCKDNIGRGISCPAQSRSTELPTGAIRFLTPFPNCKPGGKAQQCQQEDRIFEFWYNHLAKDEEINLPQYWRDSLNSFLDVLRRSVLYRMH